MPSEQEPVQLTHAETENGGIRWWRPDLVYKDILETTNSRFDAVAWTFCLIPMGWVLNGLVEHSQRQAKEREAELQRKRERIMREERWRMEAREEYRNER